jgi:hypothetical protein
LGSQLPVEVLAANGVETMIDSKAEYPELADQGYRLLRRELPDGWDKGLPTFPSDAKGDATRDASGRTLNAARAETDALPAIREVRLARVVFSSEVVGVDKEVLRNWLARERMDRH